jgi:hypothetical protein
MHEREHGHAHAQSTHESDDVVTSAHRHSSKLAAPANPIESGIVMRKARDANGVADGAESALGAASASTGASLPGPLMRKFESSLGADLSSVRVHTGGESATAANAVGARAYTVGQDIHFGAGQYDPSSAGGQHLLAHEVAHTVQQRGGTPTRQNKLEVSQPHDTHEHEADRAADAMVAGRSAEVTSMGGVSRQVWRGLATAYSDDNDLKQLPAAPAYKAGDGSFAAMATAVHTSMQGGAATLTSPTTGFDGANQNLIACRDHAESSAVYYSTNASSRWNPFGNNYGTYAKVAKDDATWAITMLANARIAGSATGSWISLANESNASWDALVKQAQAMSIEVKNKVEANPLAGLADGQKHVKQGDQQINAVEVGGSGNTLATAAKQAGIKAPDTSAYKRAMQEYSLARNKLAPQQQRIIMTLIPTNVASIKEKLQKATEEKEKWETVKEATGVFEKGLSVAFGGAAFVEGEVGAIKTTEEGLAPPEFDAKGAAEKATGVFTKVIDVRIAAIQKQIDAYDGNLKTYKGVEEAMALKAAVGEYQNGLVELRDKAKVVEDEKARMEAAFKEFGKSLDEAMIKQGKAGKGSEDNAQAAALFIAVRNASVATQGAMDGLSSGGAADLPHLYGELATHAGDRQTDQTGGDGRRDARSGVFAIENARWSTANAAIIAIRADLARRKTHIGELEVQFMRSFADASHGTDSIK